MRNENEMIEQEDDENDRGGMVQGLELFGKKQFEEAIRCFDKLIQTDPCFGDAYFWRAECYEAMIIEELGERWRQPGIPVEAMANPQWWVQNWVSESDPRVIGAIQSYEKAIELLPNSRDVLTQALDFTYKVRVVRSDVEYNLMDKWLMIHSDDVSALVQKGGVALGYDDFSVALECHKKAIELIKSFYELKERVYDDITGDTIEIIKDPEGMLEGHRSALENALLGNFGIYEEKKNYNEMLKYFWELYYLTENEFGIVNTLTYVILGVEDKSRRQKKIGEFRHKAGLTPEQFERKTIQNLLIDTCISKLRSFLRKRLTQKYGKPWWEKGCSQVRFATQSKKTNQEARHPDQPRQHSFNYLGVKDFHTIICEKNNWNNIFKGNFSTHDFIKNLIIALADFRNVVKHDGRLLEDAEIKELEVILRKIEKCTQQ